MRLPPIAGAAIPTAPRLKWLASRSGGERLHAGVDLVAPAGTPVVAPEAGEVVLVTGRDDGDAQSPRPGWRGYGPVLVLFRGDSGDFHVLAHVREAAPVGTRVDAGVQVARVSRLRHVHWEVRAAELVHVAGARIGRPRAARAAIVEVAMAPGAWLAGEREIYDAARDGCPPRPGSTARTPRACRPGARDGPR